MITAEGRHTHWMYWPRMFATTPHPETSMDINAAALLSRPATDATDLGATWFGRTPHQQPMYVGSPCLRQRNEKDALGVR